MFFLMNFDLADNAFFLLDYALAGFIIIIVLGLFLLKKINKYILYLFILGFLIGLLWEIPLGLARELEIPIATFSTSKPLLPFPFHSIIHSLWDGGIFLIGVGFIWLYSKDSFFSKFRLSELLILEVWGQIQSLIIEISSIVGGGWEYIPYWWNPSLFTINGHHFTLFPQLIWILASILFYFLA
ncbi:MAG: hypothetical protein EU551_04245, partial [Promethearchaeota archaeon]